MSNGRTTVSIVVFPATDMVFVPNIMAAGAQSLRDLDRRLMKWIVQRHAHESQVYAVCGG